MKRFNTNDYVYVKLTDLGLAEMRRQHDELKKTFPRLGDFTPPETDDNGYTRFQMHDLMKRFGHMMVLGFNTPFKTDILFDESSLHEVEP